MKKADGDGQQGLTELLRELLQIYATERMLSMLEGGNPVAAEVLHPLACDSTPLSMPQPLRRRTPLANNPPEPPQVVGVLRETLQSPPAEWEAALRAQLTDDGAAATPDMVLGALQDKMGEVVLGMPSGSRVQGVLAEMLNELISKTRIIEAEMA